MNLVDRLLLANLARLLRLADPVPPRVREDAIRAGTAGVQLVGI
jgi:hypothetical protein